MTSTDDGIQIDLSLEHFSNADSPRIDSFESGSKRKCLSFSQSFKQDLEIASTDAGIQID
jgi:hypothetical protein